MEAVGNSRMKATIDDKELLLLIALYLKDSPCTESAKALVEELSEKQLLPRRTNWEGRLCASQLQEIASNCNVHSNTLPDILQKTIVLAEKARILKFNDLKSLIGSCLSSYPDNCKNYESPLQVILKKLSLSTRNQVNSYYLLQSNQLSSINADLRRFVHVYHWDNFNLLHAILGHLAPIYCLSYDLTGQYIITGADDHLVKIWSQVDGRLLATLRGHSAEVSDIALSLDNSLIASASNDKTIRIWDSHTSVPVTTLVGHSGIVTSIQFISSSRLNFRYLVSTSTDGFAMFWKYVPGTMEFDPVPTKFMEKNRVGDRTTCSASSPGGMFFVTGCSSHIRVYDTSQFPPILQSELSSHTEQISVLQSGKTGRVCFASGARDGTAKVWHYFNSRWKDITLSACQLGRSMQTGEGGGSKWKKTVTMVSFDCTDTFVFTASSPDYVVRIWDASTGDILQSCEYHRNAVFVLEAHPIDPRILISGGHDGHIVLWDILSGKRLKVFFFEFEDEGQACIYDAKFSPMGNDFVAVDSQGHLLLFGMGTSQPYEKFPREQFFHTDYRPLVIDRQHNAIDEQAQVPPHLMPPPLLVNIDGDPHPLKDQTGILELIQKPKRFKVNPKTAPYCPPEDHSHGMLWASRLSEDDYKDALKLWENRTVIPSIDADVLKCAMDRFECLHEMEVKVFSSSCLESVEKQNSLLGDDPMHPSDQSTPIVMDKDDELVMMFSSTEEQSSCSSNGESDESDWTIDSEIAANVDNGEVCTEDIKLPVEIDEEAYSSKSTSSPMSQNEEPNLFTSTWLLQTKPLLQPYCPQIGDSVVYFPQGHMLYIEAVRNEKVYSLKNFQAPWDTYDLQDHTCCIVAAIHHHIGPPTTCSVTLVQHIQDNCTIESLRNAWSFTVKYHDMDGVLDFIILEDTFTAAISKEWPANTKFHSFIDGSWWSGNVLERRAVSVDYPNSHWLCYNVQWEDGNVESISPWDMSHIPLEDSQNQLEHEPVLEVRDNNEWNVSIRQKLLEGIQLCCECIQESNSFTEPVDLEAYPDYTSVVPVPIDLSTIIARLQNSFYRRKASLLWDVLLLFNNAVVFNEETSDIVIQAAILVHLLFNFIRNPFGDIWLYYEDVCKRNNHSLVADAKMWINDPFQFVFHGAFTELKVWKCSAMCLLDNLLLEDFTAPFLHPVDEVEYPDYSSIVSNPSDLTKIRRNLSASLYTMPGEFVNDLKLIVENSQLYNTDVHSLIYHMTQQISQWITDQLPKFWTSTLYSNCHEKLHMIHEELPSVNGSKKSLQDESCAKVYSSCPSIEAVQTSFAEFTSVVENSSCVQTNDQPISMRLRKRPSSNRQSSQNDESAIIQSKRCQSRNQEVCDKLLFSFSRHGRRIKPALRFYDNS